MKRAQLMLIIMLSVPTMAQTRLGYTLAEVLRDFPNMQYDGIQKDFEDGSVVYEITLEEVLVSYLFDADDKKCSLTQITPKTDAVLHVIVEHYNKKYVIISPTRWRCYDGDNIADIYLNKVNETGKRHFTWVWNED